jgi:hypothetical protein
MTNILPNKVFCLLNVPYFHFFAYCHFIRFENNPFALLIDVMNKDWIKSTWKHKVNCSWIQLQVNWTSSKQEKKLLHVSMEDSHLTDLTFFAGENLPPKWLREIHRCTWKVYLLHRTYSSVKSDSAIAAEMEQFNPRHSSHPTEHWRPCFLHTQRLVSQFCLQLHLMIFSSFSGAVDVTKHFLLSTVRTSNFRLLIGIQSKWYYRDVNRNVINISFEVSSFFGQLDFTSLFAIASNDI